MEGFQTGEGMWSRPFLNKCTFVWFELLTSVIISRCKCFELQIFNNLEIRLIYHKQWQYLTLKNNPACQKKKKKHTYKTPEFLKPRITTSSSSKSWVIALGIEGFPSSSVVKNPLANAGDMSLIPGLGRSPGGGNGNPL